MQLDAQPTFADFATCACLAHRVTTFLAWEARLLDEWRLEEWLALCDDAIEYVVPSTDRPEGGPEDSVVFIHDDIETLRGRVRRLQSRHAHREYPASRTRRIVSNVLTIRREDGTIEVHANFQVYRFRLRRVAVYVGRYDMTLIEDGSGFRIVRRRATLDQESLDEHGAVSIIL
jgi:p-cumate 2,3-dioxygenase subunit beta